MEQIAVGGASSGVASSAPVRVGNARKLKFFALVGVIFFTVSGGAFGIEPLIGSGGAGWALALIVATPLLWSLPIALMVSELSSVLPEEGGYFVWVREGLGEFWGVQEGWWTLCYTAVDMAIYPVLFVNYLAYFVKPLAASDGGALSWQAFFLRWSVCVGIILAALAVNWRGARAVGRNAVVNVFIVLAPFALLVAIGLSKSGAVSSAFQNIKIDFSKQPNAALVAVGFATVLWNYCGWDNVSTFAGEVEDARKNYPRALMAALPLTVAAYILPVVVGIAFTIDPKVWSDAGGFPVIAEIIGGKWLGIIIAAAAIASAWSLFNSQLLYVSRLPYAMACDGWLPRFLTKTSTRTGVPIWVLVASCFISAVFTALSFNKLVVIDILMYSAALLLEFLALIALRRTRPDLPRTFRAPGGTATLVLLTVAPMSLAAVVAVTTLRQSDADPRHAIIVAVMLAAGSVLYFAGRKTARRNRSEIELANERK